MITDGYHKIYINILLLHIEKKIDLEKFISNKCEETFVYRETIIPQNVVYYNNFKVNCNSYVPNYSLKRFIIRCITTWTIFEPAFAHNFGT